MKTLLILLVSLLVSVGCVRGAVGYGGGVVIPGGGGSGAGNTNALTADQQATLANAITNGTYASNSSTVMLVASAANTNKSIKVTPQSIQARNPNVDGVHGNVVIGLNSESGAESGYVNIYGFDGSAITLKNGYGFFDKDVTARSFIGALGASNIVGTVATASVANAVPSILPTTSGNMSVLGVIAGALQQPTGISISNNTDLYVGKVIGNVPASDLTGTVQVSALPSVVTTNVSAAAASTNLLGTDSAGHEVAVPWPALPAGGGGGTSTNIVPFFNVKTYGAVGDSNTDDSVSVMNTFGACTNAGGGTIYFPHGKYYIPNAYFNIPTNVTITWLGDGQSHDTDPKTNGLLWGGSILYWTNANDNLFTVQSSAGMFEKIAINQVPIATPGAGAAICVSNGVSNQKVDIDHVTIVGGWNAVEQHSGIGWSIHNLLAYDQHNDGIWIDNYRNPDGGDWFISDSYIHTRRWSADTAIWIQGSGGGKIVNCKINSGAFPGCYKQGIYVYPTNHCHTSNLLIANCSIENIREQSITTYRNDDSTWENIQIGNCQFLLANQGVSFNAINLNASIGNYGQIHDIEIRGNSAGTAVGIGNMSHVTMNNITTDNNVVTFQAGGTCSDITALSWINGDLMAQTLTTTNKLAGP